MATLTSTQLGDLQADLGIGADEAVFTDAELNRLFTRADGSLDKTTAFAYRQLWSNSLKFADYTQGRSSEKKSQIREGLKDALAYWEGKAGIAGGTLSVGSMNLGLDQELSDA